MMAQDKDKTLDPATKYRVRLIDFGGATTPEENHLSGSLVYASLEAIDIRIHLSLKVGIATSNYIDCVKQDIWAIGNVIQIFILQTELFFDPNKNDPNTVLAMNAVKDQIILDLYRQSGLRRSVKIFDNMVDSKFVEDICRAR